MERIFNKSGSPSINIRKQFKAVRLKRLIDTKD